MSVSPQLLKDWSRQGTIVKSKKTYDIIKKSLKRCNEKYCKGKLSYELYLQGSYKNSTNITESDIDVVVQLNSAYLSNLPGTYQQVCQEKAFRIWEEFRQCVLDILEEEFAQENIIIGNKSLKINTENNLVPIDIIPCLQYRKYSNDLSKYTTGMTMWNTAKGYQIIHYPKKHYYNGVEKQKDTDNTFKSTVRVFKNIRTELINKGAIEKDRSSSYFLECLLYNVPNEFYNGTIIQALPNVIKFLDKADISKFNQQHDDNNFKLFGDHPEQWNTDYAKNIFNEIKYFCQS